MDNVELRNCLRRWRALLLAVFIAGLAACGSAAPSSDPALVAVSTPPHAPTPPSAPHALPTAPPTVAPLTAPPPAAALLPDATATAILARAQVPSLCYHAVRDWTVADTVDDRPYIMPVKTFAAQMDFLAQAGYHTISPDQLTDYLTRGAPLPTKPVLLTFDDGDVTQWNNALPELHKHNFIATFFIMTIVLDHHGYLSSAQVQALDQQGMTVAAHTWDHQRVTRYSGDDWRIQISEPTALLAKLVKHPIKYFAYPYGLWNDDAIAQLKQAGFVAAFQLRESPSKTDPLFTIRRVIGNGFWSIARLKQALAIDF